MSQLDIFTGAADTRSAFEQDAMGFLIAFAKRSKGQSFSAEQVTLAALEAGLAPVEMRSWGAVFTQAAREGYIRRSDVLYRRVMGNGTLAPGWTGV